MLLKKKNKRIFLDYASSTPVSAYVEKEMARVRNITANPSALYKESMLAKEEMNTAREKISDILNCRSSEIVFTSGGTESDNLAILGVFRMAKRTIDKPHVVVTNVEHPAILETVEAIRREGGEVSLVRANEEGVVAVADVASALRPNTVLVSVMYANNEIGTIQPIREIGKLVKEWRTAHESTYPYFHTDACQAVLYESLDVQKLGVDLLTLDGIKMYGPRGAGLLYVKTGLMLEPILFGGGQEKGLRSGTENLSGAVGLASALEEAVKLCGKESARLTNIRDYAISKILKTFPGASLNGSLENRLPNNVNICFPGLDAEFAVVSLDVAGIATSYSSSCRTLAENSSSYVVEALGKSDCALSSLRFTLGRDTKKGDIEALINFLKDVIK